MHDNALLRRLDRDPDVGNVLVDPDVTRTYARDQMPLTPSGTPLAVVSPETVDGVRAVVRACANAAVPIVPRGAGSGLAGSANAIDGCVVLSTAKLNRILEVDPANRLAVVEPGVVNKQLRAAVAERALFYPPDPSSYDWCTIGGNLATNAGGLCCVKYGVTSDWVLGLEAVLADGSLLKAGRRTVKGVAGYDLTRLFIGSEGTLGVITQATLALRPLPKAPSTLVASFGSAAEAAATVSRIVRDGHLPALLEIMDATSIAAAEAYLRTDLGVESDDGALLLCQIDTGAAEGERETAALAAICTDSRAGYVHTTDDPAEGAMLLQARRVVLTALERYGACLTDDVCVPRDRIAELMSACQRISADVGLRIAVVGHAGDGNMHPTIIYDPATDEVEDARVAFDAILAAAYDLGGTVTGEHGIGRIKRDWLERELGPVGLRVHRQIKDALDPDGLFNPGAVLNHSRRH